MSSFNIEIPDHVRISAGQRAREQREMRRLTRGMIAHQLGVTVTRLDKWESEGLSATMRSDRIARWEQLLGMTEGSLLGELERRPDAVIERVKAVVVIECSTVGEVILAVGRQLSRHSRSVLKGVQYLTEAEERNAQIFAARYGQRGPDETSLEAVGAAHGVTRERARQVISLLVEQSSLVTFRIPLIDEVLRACRLHMPCNFNDLGLKVKHLLGPCLTLEDANRFCVEILGRQLVRVITSPSSAPGRQAERIACDSEAIGTFNELEVKELLWLARQAIRAAGAAHIGTVAGMASVKAGLKYSECVRLLATFYGFEWLDEDEQWFWFGESTPSRNIIVITMRKVFSVARNAIDINDLVAAVIRARSRTAHQEFDRPRSLMLIPPLHVFRSVLKRLSWLEVVQHDNFRAVAPQDQLAELSATEREIAQEMARLGACASRRELSASLVETGRLAFATFAVTLTASPIFARIGTGVYALIGWPLNGEAVARAASTVWSDLQRRDED